VFSALLRRIGSPFRSPLLVAAAFLAALTLLLTWPQALYLATKVANHGDPYLSMWRLEWLAHALTGGVPRLFDGNIFYPHTGTLAYSDATLLQGALAAPWLMAHANPVLVYNVLLLAGIAASGVGMFVLVRHLTGNPDAALVSAAIFTLVPYRVEHFMHLELQWTIWMPLTLWAVHRVFETGSFRQGALVGGFLCLQVLSSMYYGAYLGIMVAALTLLLAVSEPRRIAAAIAPLGMAAIIVVGVTLVYARPYMENARALGVRSADEVATFSAHLSSYVTAPAQNWVWGWTSNHIVFQGNELHLFPGLAAVLLAACALARRPRRLAWIYLVLTAVAAVLSLGLNSPIYAWLYNHVWALGGFRAPARFSILACCALAVLAGLGFSYVQHITTARRWQRVTFVAVLVAVGLEYGSLPMYLRDVPSAMPDVYKFLNTLDRSVVLELPDGLGPEYIYWSRTHWYPLVNGFSGYVPADYVETMNLMDTFPDDESIARLRRLNVRYILVHEAFYKSREFTAAMVRVLERSELVPHGRYRDWQGWTHVFELKATDG
jgi:Bacterial membrane protein YfhO